jgi:DNA polymerase-3 subunit alpha
MGENAHNNYADRKNGRKPVEPIHQELSEVLQEILGDTYGLIVYQEQVMAIAQKVAGFSLGRADLLRKAMGKKNKEILDKEYVPFEAGMKENGFSTAAIKRLWDVLIPFSDYAFNRAHSAGYGVVSFWTAYLKANFPTEYMAALLTSVRDDKDKSALYLSECRRMGIKVLPPDVNESNAEYTPRGKDIRFGLAAIRNVAKA